MNEASFTFALREEGQEAWLESANDLGAVPEFQILKNTSSINLTYLSLHSSVVSGTILGSLINAVI